MATKSGRSDASVMESLRKAPQRFEFVQALRLLERAAVCAAGSERFAASGVLGMDGDPRRESVRLRAALELAFPSAEIAALDDQGSKPEMSVTLMGLNGVSGVLPAHYSRYLLEASRDKNEAPRDFYDLFNHRALSLFMRAADKYRMGLAFERAHGEDDDPISGALRALIGMRGATLRNRQAVSDETLIFYAGQFAHRPRTADSLRQILEDHFRLTVAVKQFQGRWAYLKRSEQTQLGGGTRRPAGYAVLGESAILGARVWDVQGSFRVHIGALDYEQFQGFMPGTAQTSRLAALGRTFAGPALNFDLQLLLLGSEVPPLRLGGEASEARLGWNTWLPTSGPRSSHASDAIFAV